MIWQLHPTWTLGVNFLTCMPMCNIYHKISKKKPIHAKIGSSAAAAKEKKQYCCFSPDSCSLFFH